MRCSSLVFGFCSFSHTRSRSCFSLLLKPHFMRRDSLLLLLLKIGSAASQSLLSYSTPRSLARVCVWTNRYHTHTHARTPMSDRDSASASERASASTKTVLAVVVITIIIYVYSNLSSLCLFSHFFWPACLPACLPPLSSLAHLEVIALHALSYISF